MSVTNPQDLHDAFENAINASDAEALRALYDTKGIAVGLDGSEITGDEAMNAMFVGLAHGITTIKGTTRKLYVVGDICLSSASWVGEMTLPDGTVVTQEGTTAEVAQRQADGTWKFVIDDPMFV